MENKLDLAHMVRLQKGGCFQASRTVVDPNVNHNLTAEDGGEP